MKRLIPKTHSISVFLWRDEIHKDISKWHDFENGMSAKSTGAGSLTAAMKIVREGLKSGYTHFLLSYPVTMQGPSTIGNPHGHPMYNNKYI